MSELAYPFVQAWNYVGRVGGYPGQVFAVLLVVIVIIGGLTWISNRR